MEHGNSKQEANTMKQPPTAASLIAALDRRVATLANAKAALSYVGTLHPDHAIEVKAAYKRAWESYKEKRREVYLALLNKPTP